jgi:phosphoribosylanthranilate isomerase
VEVEAAREIVATLPPLVDAVGVFVNEDPSVVKEIAQYCGLTMVQLHGRESVDYCRGLGLRIIKTFAVHNGSDGNQFAPYAGAVSGFLLDTYHEKMAGGSGKVFDWNLVDRFDIPGPVILAGGIAPGNVFDAILRVRPFAVDVNSGVEKDPGLKDPDLVRALAAEVRRADESLHDPPPELRTPR